MSNHALLVEAAKAAGIDIGWDSQGAYVRVAGVSGSDIRWSPLTDDGDAFRLLVDRRFNIKDFAPRDSPEIVQAPPDGSLFGLVEIWREDDSDPLHTEWYKAGADRRAVTRRAIVRAAAIGAPK